MIESGQVTTGRITCNKLHPHGGKSEGHREHKNHGRHLFWAQSDRDWVLDGAAVNVSMIGFDSGAEQERFLDGKPVVSINSDLTSAVDVSRAVQLNENANLVFLGMMKGGPFEITSTDATAMLQAPVNPNGKPNSDVVKRRLGAQDITGRTSAGWVIDFVDMTQQKRLSLSYRLSMFAE